MAKDTLRKASNETISALRIRAIALWKKGIKQQVIADTLVIGLSTLQSWIKAYKERGSKSFTLKPRGIKPGSGSKDLSASHLNKIRTTMTDKFPDQLKLPFTLWTRAAVQAFIIKKYNVKKSLVQIGRYLKDWGFSAQKPIYKAYEQDEESVKKFLTKEYPKIKRKAKKEGAEIYFGDEAGMRSDHHAGKSYAKKGKTPVVKKTGKRFSVNMISAISAKGNKRFMLYSGKFNSDRYILFLTQLIKNSPRKIYLIMDNYAVHKTKKVLAWIENHKDKLEVFYLPTYSPELNPDELLNQDIKTNLVGKTKASNAHELKQNIKTHLKKMSKEKVSSFFEHQYTKYAA